MILFSTWSNTLKNTVSSSNIFIYIEIIYILILLYILNYILFKWSRFVSGFEVADRGCCGKGLLAISYLCNSLNPFTCSNSSAYIFWDSYHPSERAYQVIVDNLLDKYLSKVYWCWTSEYCFFVLFILILLCIHSLLNFLMYYTISLLIKLLTLRLTNQKILTTLLNTNTLDVKIGCIRPHNQLESGLNKRMMRH